MSGTPEGWEWDDDKAERNLSAHGVAFEAVARLNFETIIDDEDRRFEYGERRFRWIVAVNGRLHVLIFTWRNGTKRVISLRKANLRERRYHEEASSSRAGTGRPR